MMDSPWHKTFAETHGTSKNFEDCMVRIASLSYKREETVKVLNQLRFLVVDWQYASIEAHNNEASELHSEQSHLQFLPPSTRPERFKLPKASATAKAHHCRCSRLPAFSTEHRSSPNHRTQRPVLRLTSPGEMAGCTHFVAVSYTWNQPPHARKCYEGTAGYSIITDTEVRQNRAPVNILDRIIEYAIMRRIRCIWIDQECIDQEDAKDKERHVQAMDEIYRAARQVVAVLNLLNYVDQTHADAFEYIEMVSARSISHPDEPRLSTRESRATVHKMVGELQTDQWFSRAWTYQESLVAASTLHVLVNIKPGTRLPRWMGLMSDQAVLDLWFLSTLFTGWGLSKIGKMSPEYKTPSAGRSDSPMSFTHRLGCMDAYEAMHKLGLANEADRVAIIANLCRYKYRVDIAGLAASGIDLETAIYTQALLNGDLSCLLRSERMDLFYRLTKKDEARNVKARPWARVPSANLLSLYRVRDSKPFISSWDPPGCRISPTMLTPQGGLVCEGFLFEFRRVNFGEFSSCRADFIHLNYHLEVNEIDINKLSGTLSRIINTLYAEGLGKLARGVVAAAKLCGVTVQLPEGTACHLPPALQAMSHNTSDTKESTVMRQQHEWRSQVQTVFLASERPVSRKQSRALHLLYMLLSSVVREQEWMVGTTHDTDFRLIFALPEKSLAADDGTAMFLPRRVLIHSEAERGAADRLPFWEVHVGNTTQPPIYSPTTGLNVSVPTLTCVGRTGMIWESQEWQDRFFWGDWGAMSGSRGAAKYLLV
ncbi:heterokaryon incompatibility protein-domain-containing protein [Xylariales sp. PMI_506]|nr:heterokaryon incompatibility protein-domain-containing protein [Xylariales sp. PMI_506]